MRKSVLVTGSSRGIGKAIALRLARDDYDIVLHCRSRREEADSVARSIVALGRQARVLQFDVGERHAICGGTEGGYRASMAATTAWCATPGSRVTMCFPPCPARTGTSY